MILDVGIACKWLKGKRRRSESNRWIKVLQD
jgi:hypothetical protein